MTEQGEFDFSAGEEPPLPRADKGTLRATGNRRLKVIAASSILFAGLTTAMLVRLHASPVPADATTDTSLRPPFPEAAVSTPQVFVAPRLSTIREVSSTTAATTQTASDSAAPLSMPFGGPNAQWRLPAGTAETGFIAPPSEMTHQDLLMVDLPPQAGGDSGREEGVIHARHRDPHGLTLAAGSIIGCALETAIDSSRGGFVTCVVTDDVVSDDARAVVIERGTHVLGEYHSDARLGDSRIGIVWNRLRKSDGTTVDLASPGTDQRGRSGITGAVDNHWFTRIGAAVLLSVIEDGISAASAPKANGTTLVFSNTAATGSTLSQKVLDASINLPPTITINPGARISILVAKDIDFRSAYAYR